MSAASNLPSLPVWPARLPRKGDRLSGTLDALARAELAAALGIAGIEALAWDLHARPWRKTGFEVTGHVRGRAVQSCIITLAPVEQEIDEPVDMRFLPEEKAGEGVGLARRAGQEPLDIRFDATPDDEPDLFATLPVDLFAVVSEHFALGLDPYPRAPGAAFDAAQPSGEDAAQPAEESAMARALRQWRGAKGGANGGD